MRTGFMTCLQGDVGLTQAMGTGEHADSDFIELVVLPLLLAFTARRLKAHVLGATELQLVIGRKEQGYGESYSMRSTCRRLIESEKNLTSCPSVLRPCSKKHCVIRGIRITPGGSSKCIRFQVLCGGLGLTSLIGRDAQKMVTMLENSIIRWYIYLSPGVHLCVRCLLSMRQELKFRCGSSSADHQNRAPNQ